MARVIRIGLVLATGGFLAIGMYFYYGSTLSEVLIADRMSEFVDVIDYQNVKNEHKLILFDLDDTVFMSSQLLGTPTWFYNMVNLLRKSGAAKYEAYHVLRIIDKVVQEKIPVIPVEQATLSAIRTWQSLGATVVGMTSKTKDFAGITKSQLADLGLRFSSPYFSCVENMFEEPVGALIDGVLYGENEVAKGVVVEHFINYLESCGADVQLVAHADDQQRYVTEIAKIAKKNRKDYVGIIYGGALSLRNFNLNQSKRELMNLEASLNAPIIPEEYRRIFSDVAE